MGKCLHVQLILKLMQHFPSVPLQSLDKVSVGVVITGVIVCYACARIPIHLSLVMGLMSKAGSTKVLDM